MTTKVLFVCLGNICRSPLAESLFRHHVKEAGLDDAYEIDSAGTSSYHVGESPDRRMQATVRRHGLKLTGRARQFHQYDFDKFDLIIAMDRQNRANILRLARDEADRNKVRMLREFDPEVGDPSALPSVAGRALDVPDPWYGDADGFEDVFQIADRSSRRLLAELEQE